MSAVPTVELGATIVNAERPNPPIAGSNNPELRSGDAPATQAAGAGQAIPVTLGGNTTRNRASLTQRQLGMKGAVERLAEKDGSDQENASPREWDRLADLVPIDLSSFDEAVGELSERAGELGTALTEFLDVFDYDGMSPAVVGAVFASVSGVAVHRVLWKGRTRLAMRLDDDESMRSWLLETASIDA